MRALLIALLLLVAPTPAVAVPASSGGPGAHLIGAHLIGAHLIGGSPATEAYPFAASLQTSTGAHLCGGALIRPSWVVTARHCVQGQAPSALRGRVGSLNPATGGTAVLFTRFVLHPGGDVALLQLRAAVAHQPIALADSVPVGSAVRLLGWGPTCVGCAPPQVLHQLDTTVVADSLCGAGAADFCVANPDGRGPCQGDSGGPAIQKAGTWRLAGVHSRNTSTVCGLRPAVYADLAAHGPWITGVVGA